MTTEELLDNMRRRTHRAIWTIILIQVAMVILYIWAPF
jgi:hypothetical protein